MNTAGGAGPVLLGFAISFGALAAYFAPAIVAVLRRVPNTGSVIVIDLLLGWTVIGWIAALAMACRSKPRPYAAWPPPHASAPAPPRSGYLP